MRIHFASSVFIWLSCCSAQADIINVPGDEPTIQIAINASNPGDVVIVAEGEYFENINFFGKAITVRSTDPKDSAVVMKTIINAGGAGNVVTCTSNEGPGTVLSGFIITNGNTPFDGGGMLNSNSSPTVTNCSFIGNTASQVGGGMANFTSNPTLTNCSFIGNSSDSPGGGISNFSSDPVLTNCSFIGNTASAEGGGMFNFGSDPTLNNCSFIGNEASGNFSGGGMFNSGASLPTLNDTGLCNNIPDQIIGTFTGIGFSIGSCAPQIPMPASCPADLTADSQVTVTDLLAMLASWGVCP